jgi:hypothetical protein
MRSVADRAGEFTGPAILDIPDRCVLVCYLLHIFFVFNVKVYLYKAARP